MYTYLEKGKVVHSRSFDIFVGESIFAEKLTTIQDRFTGLDIGSYPFSRDGKYGATIVIRSTDENKLDACEEEIQNLIKEY
jgi:molybdopterin-biosynthesis enzyme MoeA-like protein